MGIAPSFVKPQKLKKDDWYILFSNIRYGPMKAQNLVSLLTHGQAHWMDFVWHEGLDSWAPLYQMVEELPANEQQKKQADSMKSVPTRRSPRLDLQLKLKAHDHRRLWRGDIGMISTTGALARMDNPVLLPGHHITVQIEKQLHSDHNIEVEAQLIGKRLHKDKSTGKVEVYYALEFLQISNAAETQIKTYMERVIAKMPNLQEVPQVRPLSQSRRNFSLNKKVS